MAEWVGLAAVREAREAGRAAVAEQGPAPALARYHDRQHAGETHQARGEQLLHRGGTCEIIMELANKCVGSQGMPAAPFWD